MTAPAANPDIPLNQTALEVTKMQAQQAQQLAADLRAPGLVPYLLVALALNRSSLAQK